MFSSRTVACGITLVSMFALWSSGREAGATVDAQVRSSPLFDVTLDGDPTPSSLAPARASRLASRADRAAQSGTEVIEHQDFEAADFPPEGWETWDNDHPSGGPEETYTWGPQDCDVAAESTGVKTAWSVGGGRLGEALLCGGNYDAPARSWLARTGIDTRAFPGGIQVNLLFKVDIPRDEAFQICASTEIVTTIACSRALEPTPGRWISFREPIHFPRAAGLENAAVILRYEDPAPDGSHIGVFVDDIVIEGLLGAPPPSPTSTTAAGPTATATTRPPDPTAPVPTGPRVFMPLAFRNHDLRAGASAPPTASPGRVSVEFAEDFLEDGTAIRPGPRFAYGILQLCAKQSWFDVPVGQTIRRQWYEWDGSEYLPLGGPDLNSGFEATTANGFSEQCVQWVDEADDSLVPVPVGRYRVDLFQGSSTTPSVTGIAEVLDSAPASPTSGPGPGPTTPVPTPEPTGSTPVPTPGPGDCLNPIENGDFEAGPGVGWIESTASSGGLIRGEVTFGGSRFAALFGTVLGVQEILQSRRAIPVRPAEEVEAATLRFVLFMNTDETPGSGEETDIFGVCFGGDSPTDVECVARATEDTWPEGRWIAVEQDVTDFVVLREGFSRSTPLFIGQSNATLTTNFAMDDVELEVCFTGGERLLIPIDVGAVRGGSQAPYRLGDALDAPLAPFRRASSPAPGTR